MAEQPELRVLVLAGEGCVFSSGADLATFERLVHDDRSARAAADAGARAADAIEALDVVTVAAIHGRCVGGGVVRALACDLRLAATGTRFAIPEVDLGIPLAWGGVPRLLREVGPGVARDLILTCREFGAEEALALWLVSRVVRRRATSSAFAGGERRGRMRSSGPRRQPSLRDRHDRGAGGHEVEQLDDVGVAQPYAALGCGLAD